MHSSHRFHVEPTVVYKPTPIFRMSLPRRYGTVRAGGAEKADEPFAVLVLRFIRREMTDLAKVSQSAGERKRESLDHRIEPPVRISGLGEIFPEDSPVKIGVMRAEQNFWVPEQFNQLLRPVSSGHIRALRGDILLRISAEQDPRVLCVLIHA